MRLPKAMEKSTTGFVSNSWLFKLNGAMRVVRSIFQLNLLWLFLGGVSVQAQIVPDATLGSERSTLIPRASGGDQITGGAIRGMNLFHSFSDFNVGTGQQVYFASPTGIMNILTRVTGNTASNIDGTLGVDGSANLFLLNPNGIIFGQNARLDVRGSFLATTANAIGFGTQGSFSATNPSGVPLLTVQPSVLLYTQIQGSGIVNQGANLGVPTGQSLLLAGGDVKQDGGNLGASDGRIEFGGLSAPGSISLNQTGAIWSLGLPEEVARSNVSLSNSSSNTNVVDVTGNGGGSIAVTAKDSVISGNVYLITGIGQGKGAIGARAGDITIDSTNSVTLSQGSYINSLVQDGAVGDGGNIVIKTGTLLVQDGSEISNYHLGQGNSGNILITARDNVTLSGINGKNSSSISTFANRGQGNTGSIQIATGSLFVKDGASLETSIDRPGNSGNITINARDAVIVDGAKERNPSAISTTLSSDGVGNAGDIQIDTSTFTALNGGFLTTQSFGRGNSGNIIINARDSVTFSGSINIPEFPLSSSANSSVFGVGNGGNIEITTGSLFLTEGGDIETGIGSGGQGNSGRILITARDSVKVDGAVQNAVTFAGQTFNVPSFIGSSTSGFFPGLLETSIGNGGDIQIDTGILSVTNGAYVGSSTGGQGNAGSITINARDSILVDGSGKLLGTSNINSRVLGSAVFPDGTFSPSATGRGGNISLTTGELTVSNGGFVSSSTNGNGDAGNLSVFARDSVTISGVSSIDSTKSSRISTSATSGSIGQGGTLQLRTGTLSILAGGTLSSANRGTGGAGSIEVQANSIQLKDNSSIETLTTSGNGGNLFLTAKDVLLLRRGSSITASATALPTQANAGNSGNITIDAGQIIAPLQENNTIAANATKGNGGNVGITTQGLYGIEARSTAIPGLSSITASSDLGVQGNIAIAQPQTQPVQGAIELPTTILDASNQLSQICPRTPELAKAGRFIISGSGSLPPSPTNPLTGTIATSTLATLDSLPSNHEIATTTTKALPPAIVEAQGWVKTPDGKVELVAHTNETMPTTIAACPKTESVSRLRN